MTDMQSRHFGYRFILDRRPFAVGAMRRVSLTIFFFVFGSFDLVNSFRDNICNRVFVLFRFLRQLVH